jgi:hypothetical protein
MLLSPAMLSFRVYGPLPTTCAADLLPVLLPSTHLDAASARLFCFSYYLVIV